MREQREKIQLNFFLLLCSVFFSSAAALLLLEHRQCANLKVFIHF